MMREEHGVIGTGVRISKVAVNRGTGDSPCSASPDMHSGMGDSLRSCGSSGAPTLKNHLVPIDDDNYSTNQIQV